MSNLLQTQFGSQLIKNRNIVYTVINSYFPNNDMDDDIFQDVSLRAWEAYQSFRGECPFPQWISKITKYTCIDKLRRLKAQAYRIATYNMFYEYSTSIIDEPYSETHIPVIDSLSDVEKRTLQMRIEGLTFSEISAITGEPLNRLLIRMHRIKERLSKSLKNYNP